MPVPIRRPAIWLITGLLLACGITHLQRACADVFYLQGGGELRGTPLSATNAESTDRTIRTVTGIVITLPADQIERVETQRPVELEYERLRVAAPDTIPGHMQMADWARDNGLDQQREAHLNRIIELDPDHAVARGLLGYSRQNGKWYTREELMTERGWVQFEGRWMLPHKRQLIVERRKNDQSEKEWFQKLKRWRDWLTTDRAQQAADSIRAVNDPFAVKALQRRLYEEPQPEIRVLYLQALANINTPDATLVLVDEALEDPVEEVRLTALDHLKRQQHPEVIKRFISKLDSKDNVIVNRAAVGLRHMDNPAAIPALVDSLFTTHKYQVVTSGGGGGPGNISTAFGSGSGGLGGNGGGGLSVGGGPTIVSQQLRNPEVLNSLVELSGVNFDFDQRAWKAWLASRRQPDSINTRRD